MKTPASTPAPARLGVVCVLLLFGPGGLSRAQPNPPAARVDFVRDIQPLLERSCIGCHGPVKPKSGHRVDTRDAIIKGGESQDAAIVPGHSEKSPLVHFVSGLVPDMEMPPLDKQDKYPALSPGEIALVRAWIDQGASWPEGVQLRVQPPRPLQAGPVAGPVARAHHEIFAHIRRGDAPAIAAALQDRSVLETRDEAGNTPLIRAAFYLDAAHVEMLLQQGADSNAANAAGATALMRAAADLDKVRVLLRGHAKVDTASAAGNTALMIACRGYGAAAVVQELLAHGANVNATNQTGASALTLACEVGDEDVVRLLLTQGANANATHRPPYAAATESALMIASAAGHVRCVELLLAHGADPLFASAYGNALHSATRGNRVEVARILLDRGVEVNLPGRLIQSFRNDLGMTPLLYAAMTERDEPGLVDLLIRHGAKTDVKNSTGETALAIARRRGETRVVAALRAAGAPDAGTAAEPQLSRARFTPAQVERGEPAVLREAVETALDVLLRSGVRFNEATANRCVTCHQHSLPSLARSLAREKQFAFDAAVAAELDHGSVKTAARRLEHALEETLPVPTIAAWLLIGLQAAGHPADDTTDAYAHSLARSQFSSGRWISKVNRAPTDYSDITSTALSLRALQLYAPPTLHASFQHRIQRAAAWLGEAGAESTEERAMQLLGLRWAGSTPDTLQRLSAQLVKQQRSSGGWAQLPTLEADAYATGLALYALHEAGGLSPSDDAYRNGVRFLLREQQSDGSWRVETRASPVQVAVDGVFAHDQHQWISSSATSWSTMALILAAAAEKKTAVSSPARE